MNVGESVSMVNNLLNMKNQDDRISSRQVFAVLRSVATTFISRKLNELKLHRDFNLYKTQKVELEEIDAVSCGVMEFKTCNTIMKSKKPLKNLVFYNGGASVKNVSNLDRTISIEKTDLKQLMRNKKRFGYDNTKPFYYIDGEGFVYVVNSNIECVLVDVLSVGIDEEDCLNPALEQGFYVPSKLENDIFQTAVQELLLAKKIPTDDNPNLSAR